MPLAPPGSLVLVLSSQSVPVLWGLISEPAVGFFGGCWLCSRGEDNNATCLPVALGCMLICFCRRRKAMQRAFPGGWRKDFSSLHKLAVTYASKKSRVWSLA